jgi:ergothioneine biosynthesis protein EgtB
MGPQHARAATAPEIEPLSSKYSRVRAASLFLTTPLTPEDQVVQPVAEASPTKWHLAHTTWFFERFVLAEHAPGYAPYDPRFDYLFNSYYYTVGEMHGRSVRGLLSRPTVNEICAYRARVDDAVLDLISRGGSDPAVAALVVLGLNHEQQHQELLLTDIKQVFFANPLGPAYLDLPIPPTHEPPRLHFVGRAGGVCAIGAAPNGEGEFRFDNETPRHSVLLSDYALANRLVTNAEYLDFVAAGGYRDPKLWLADGWAKIRELGWDRPLCWSEDKAREFTLGGWRHIDPHAPVCHVSYYEADAFARWAGARLPTEAEWELAAAETTVAGNLLDTGHYHPIAGRTASPQTAVSQLWGDVWEWCASSYGPYPGFEPLAGSLGEYNGKFMCNQLVVRGGSCVTWSDHLRPTYRSFFYPHDRWQFLGFRLAKNA